MARDRGEKELKLESTNSNYKKDEVKILNNSFGLALKLSQNFALGIKVFTPKYRMGASNLDIYPDGSASSYSYDTKVSVMGLGPGITYQFAPKLFAGMYYIKIKEKTFSQSRYTPPGGAATSENVDETLTRTQYGFGLSYLHGKGESKGLRLEAAYSKLIHPANAYYKQLPGEEFYGALEFAINKSSFGVSAKYRKNLFFTNYEVLEYAIGDKSYSEKFTPIYGAFITLGSSRGHTFGLSGLYYQSNGKRKLFGTDKDANSTLKEVTFNYAYIF